MNNNPLTQRQVEVLQFIKSFVSKNGYPPTVREIAQHMKYQSASTAFSILEVLVRKGYIKKGSGPRMLRVIEQKNERTRGGDPPL